VQVKILSQLKIKLGKNLLKHVMHQILRKVKCLLHIGQIRLSGKMAKVSWMWGGKRYHGTLIRETKTHKFARTENGKIKKIKK
jgi:hypothetical protein